MKGSFKIQDINVLLVPDALFVPDALLGPGREPVDGVSLVHDNLSQTQSPI